MRLVAMWPRRWLLWLALVGGLCGCGGPPVTTTVETAAPPPPSAPAGYPDHVLLKEAVKGERTLSPQEVAELSDRLLIEGSSTFKEDETMARLELLLLKAVKDNDPHHRHRFLRNLGIIHYHQKQYKRSRQELQAANELNPRDARTHYYLARLLAIEGAKYERKGQKKKSRGQFKLSATELALARKLEPNNPLYQQDVKQLLRQDLEK